MQRTKIEKYTYAVLAKEDLAEIGFLDSIKELKSKKTQNDFLRENNYDYEKTLLVLVDTETATYYMDDEKFFELAEKVVEG